MMIGHTRIEQSKMNLPSVYPWCGRPNISVVEKPCRISDAYKCSKIPPEDICLETRSTLFKTEDNFSNLDLQNKVAVAIWPGMGTYDRDEFSKFIDIHKARRTRTEVSQIYSNYYNSMALDTCISI